MPAKDPYVLIGIPTWCEASTIRSHVETLDSLANRLLPSNSFQIVVADNCSPDGTGAAALSASTKGPIQLLESAPGARGKGVNFELLFRHALAIGADVLITLDADLEFVPEDWIPRFIQAVHSSRCDLAVPLYPRFWYDGNLTNQIVAPLVLAVTGFPIRQPIGGDFAFSPRAMQHLLGIPWPDRVRGFGIDVFCVLRCMRAGFVVKQVPLSTGKVHSWRSDTSGEVVEEMSSKFEAITGTLLDELSWKGWSASELLPMYPLAPPLSTPPKDYRYEHLVELAGLSLQQYRHDFAFRDLLGLTLEPESTPTVSDRLWAEVLAKIVFGSRAGQMGARQYEIFQSLFFLRIATVIPSLRQDEVEARTYDLACKIHEQLLLRMPAGDNRIAAPGLTSGSEAPADGVV